VIIFSKTYCPYSKRAKGILLEKYHIDPAPYVVELDEHPLGPQLQAKVGAMTGRRTVPNIMISGKSIGGCDDIVALDSEKALEDKITTTSVQKILVEQRFVDGEKDI
jgi:glutaredoxin